MNLKKRLSGISVKKIISTFLVLAMMITMVNIPVTIASDEDTDVYTIYNWDGMLIKGNNAWSEAEVGLRYGLNGGTNNVQSIEITATKATNLFFKFISFSPLPNYLTYGNIS